MARQSPLGGRPRPARRTRAMGALALAMLAAPGGPAGAQTQNKGASNAAVASHKNDQLGRKSELEAGNVAGAWGDCLKRAAATLDGARFDGAGASEGKTICLDIGFYRMRVTQFGERPTSGELHMMGSDGRDRICPLGQVCETRVRTPTIYLLFISSSRRGGFRIKVSASEGVESIENQIAAGAINTAPVDETSKRRK